MIPTLALPGDVAPGQFGPMRWAPARRTSSTTGIMSSAGMPSVMQKIVVMPAATPRARRRVRPRAGTKMHDVLTPVSLTASATVLNTGIRPSSVVWPPLPGVTPATSGVPYSSIARLWNSPSRPVMPWTTSRVSRSIRMLTPRLRLRRRDGLGRRLVEALRRHEPGRLEQLGRLGGVGADDPDDHRDVADLLGAGLDEPARDLVAAGDAAEDVDEDRLDVLVLEDQPHRRRHPVGLRAAADVEEVGRLAAGPLHEVHRRHREAGAVDHAADVALELDERQVVAARLDVGRVLGVEVAQRLEVGVAGERRVVERDLRVEADEPLDAASRPRCAR